jgi:hypothetical protein
MERRDSEGLPGCSSIALSFFLPVLPVASMFRSRRVSLYDVRIFLQLIERL